MNFKEFLVWRIQMFFQNRRPCKTCRGFGLRCGRCGEYHRFYQKDWRQAYCLKQRKKGRDDF